MREKKDRATTEQVLDPRTRLILYKMLNRHFASSLSLLIASNKFFREVITEINGCISTGKEVYFTRLIVCIDCTCVPT